jgi:hypothetical protein
MRQVLMNEWLPKIAIHAVVGCDVNVRLHQHRVRVARRHVCGLQKKNVSQYAAFK